MPDPQIRFDDGAAYEEFMGKWSRLAGATFLDWLAPPAGWRWADIGCGNGAFTEMIVQRHAPASVSGIDPSPEQLEFARHRLAGSPLLEHLQPGGGEIVFHGGMKVGLEFCNRPRGLKPVPAPGTA